MVLPLIAGLAMSAASSALSKGEESKAKPPLQEAQAPEGNIWQNAKVELPSGGKIDWSEALKMYQGGAGAQKAEKSGGKEAAGGIIGGVMEGAKKVLGGL